MRLVSTHQTMLWYGQVFGYVLNAFRSLASGSPSEKDYASYRNRTYAPPKEDPLGKLEKILDLILDGSGAKRHHHGFNLQDQDATQSSRCPSRLFEDANGLGLPLRNWVVILHYCWKQQLMEYMSRQFGSPFSYCNSLRKFPTNGHRLTTGHVPVRLRVILRLSSRIKVGQGSYFTMHYRLASPPKKPQIHGLVHNQPQAIKIDLAMFCLSCVSKSSVEAGKPHRNSADDISAPPSPTTTETEPPEGGLEAWCTVLGCFLAQFCGFGYTNAFGVYQAFYTQNYLASHSSSAISWIGSVATFMVTGIGPVCGPLFDRGYFVDSYHVYISGAILQSFSIFMLSFVKPGNYYQVLLAQGLGSGIGQGLMYLPSLAVLSHHFNRRRTAVMSIAVSGVALGGIVHTIMLNQLLNGSVGFQTGVRASAAFISGFASEVWIHAKDNIGEFLQGNKEVPYGGAFASDNIWHGLSTSFAFYSCCGIGILYGLFSGMNLAMTGPMLALTSDPAELGVRMGVGFAIIAMKIDSIRYIYTKVSVVYSVSPRDLTVPVTPSIPSAHHHDDNFVFGITRTGSPICGALLTSRYIWWAPALFCVAIALAAGLFFVALRVVLFRTVPKAKNAVKEVVA
ncbi:major facilitator superfamily domain-containing protein [Melanogaster broomeanus]|nr:major facilitator superfamily domain-containing protein [Melanogaster broomeanus]